MNRPFYESQSLCHLNQVGNIETLSTQLIYILSLVKFSKKSDLSSQYCVGEVQMNRYKSEYWIIAACHRRLWRCASAVRCAVHLIRLSSNTRSDLLFISSTLLSSKPNTLLRKLFYFLYPCCAMLQCMCTGILIELNVDIGFAYSYTHACVGSGRITALKQSPQ